MKTIHKLVLKAYIGPLVVTFFIINFVLMMNFVWRYIDELVGKGLDTWVIIELLCYATINMITYGLPLTMLLAAIMTMGNLGENYELLAMKSAGMSLMRILKPLIALVLVVAVGGFFIINDLVPYTNRKMASILYDINRQKQTLEFQDGLFFNGIDNMSIRVEKQDDKTGLLHNVLIYDNRNSNGNMTTTIAESGYIRLSDNKKYLLVTLFNGETYEQTRNSQWYNKSTLRRHVFERQDGTIPMSGFDFERSDESAFGNGHQTSNINQLQHSIDSLDLLVNSATAKSYDPLLNQQIFAKDNSILMMPDDSLYVDHRGFRLMQAADSLPALGTRDKNAIWKSARSTAKGSRNMFAFDESTAKEALNQLYRSKNEWHRKLAFPVAIIIFFLIGAPLGAIIRKGGFGTPIVISVLFFVVYYVISISGEKNAREGEWSSLAGMWISAIVLTPIAIYLTYKATNDSALLDIDWYVGRYKHYRSAAIAAMPAWMLNLAAKLRKAAEKLPKMPKIKNPFKKQR